jgi:hypothetical protein
MRCSRPGRGASATGPEASTARPPAATASSKRGSRTQTIKANACSHQCESRASPRPRIARASVGSAFEPICTMGFILPPTLGSQRLCNGPTLAQTRWKPHITGYLTEGIVGPGRIDATSRMGRAPIAEGPSGSRPVSRILSMSSHPSERPTWTLAGNLQTVLLGLASGGVCQAAASPRRRCALTAPFHPCRPETADAAPDVGGVISVALSREFPRVGVTDHPAL